MRARICYTVDTGEKLVNEILGPNRKPRANGKQRVFRMQVRDGRGRSFSLDENGFLLVQHRTRVKDFFEERELKAVYYPELARLVKRICGARRVRVFNHMLRSGDKGEREARELPAPVLLAHNDYTACSAPRLVRDLMGSEAEALLARRFAIIQVWRAIDQPIRSDPLAIADATSVAPQDLLVEEWHHNKSVGEIYRLVHSARHRWYYFPEMLRDEAIVFKAFDSATDGRARFTAHTSFEDPATPPGAPPRQSIEARALAFF
jgi:hypothetical protein